MRAALLCLCLTAAAWPADDLAGLHRVAYDDAGQPGKQPHLLSGEDWRYPEAAIPAALIPADSPLRTVAFGDPVRFGWLGLRPEAAYRLRLVYTSDSDQRVQRLTTSGKVLLDNLKLPYGKPLETVVELPREFSAGGSAEIEIHRLAGPNAVVAEVELWSSEPTLLPYLTVTAEGDLQGHVTVTARDEQEQPAAGVEVTLQLDDPLRPPLPPGEGGGEGPVASARQRPHPNPLPGGEGVQIEAVTSTDGIVTIAIPSGWGSGDQLIMIEARRGAAEGHCTVTAPEISAPRYTPLPVDPAPIELDGAWLFHPAPPEQFAVAPGSGWQPIVVPGEWALQGFSVEKGRAAGYRRSFTVPAGWTGKRLLLRFDGVYSECRAWVNGRLAGGHLGGFTPFELDITELAHAGTNQLALAVTNESRADALSSGSGYAAHPLGGINRRVRLFAVPAEHLTSLHAWTTFDPGYREATVHVGWAVAPAPSRPVQVQFALTDPSGVGLPLPAGEGAAGAALGGPQPSPLPAGEGTESETTLRVASPQTWDPEHPRLYTLEARLQAGGKVSEIVRLRIGLRQIEVRGNRIFVNGKPVKLHGVCRHEAHPRYGRALRDGLWRRDAQLFRDANTNFVRTSHYPPDERFLEACDELGILVEDEAPFCWASPNEPANRAPTLRQTLEMVARDRSHPCVLLWSIANESTWGTNFAAAAAAVQRLDRTRPRIFSYGSLDVASWHYPGEDGPARANEQKLPVLFDEYAHLNCYNRRELAADPGVRDDWGERFAAMWEKMQAAPGCLGGSLWAGIDDVFVYPDGHEVGYGQWGVIDGWRRAKPEWWHVKKAYSPLRMRVTAQDAGGFTVQVENRHDFTDLRELRLEWRRGKDHGRLALAGAPHTVATAKAASRAGGPIVLEGWSLRGFLIDKEVLADAPSGPVSPRERAGVRAVPKQADSDSIWQVEAQTGQLTATWRGRPVLIGGPTAMLLPVDPVAGGTTHAADIAPLNDLCTGWQAASVTSRQADGALETAVEGTWNEAEGGYVVRLEPDGRVAFRWHLAPKADLSPRQVGVVFDLAAGCTRLRWERQAFWSWYPEDHIGRPRGLAQCDGGTLKPADQPWSTGRTALGSNDFRATRSRVVWAELGDGKAGLHVDCGGKASIRAWRAGDRIRLLVAGLDNGTSEPFFAAHTAGSRRNLKAGEMVEGAFTMSLRGE